MICSCPNVHLVTLKLNFGRRITSKGVAPIESENDNFFKTSNVSKVISTVHWVCSVLQAVHTEKLVPLYKLFQKDETFTLTQVLQNCIFDLTENFAKAAKLSLRLHLPDKQLVIMCDASEHAAVYVLLIEDYTEKDGATLKS